MLSKQKIELATYSLVQNNWSKIVGNPYCPDDLAKDLFEDGVEAGATWASEQYAGVVKALEGMLKAFNEHYALTGVANRARLSAISELNKLKQP